MWIQATDSLTSLGADWAAAWGTALTALNRRRDTMRRDLAAGLLLVGPPEQNLDDAERVLSPDHPLTATIRENLERARLART